MTVNQLLEGQLKVYLALTVSIHHKDDENQPPVESMKTFMTRETMVQAERTERILNRLCFRNQHIVDMKVNKVKHEGQLSKKTFYNHIERILGQE